MKEADPKVVDAQVVRDMEWTLEFLQSILADPSILDEIPDEASVFLLPDDDPELAEANRRGAARARQRGHPVYVRRMPPRQATANGRPIELQADQSENATEKRTRASSRLIE